MGKALGHFDTEEMRDLEMLFDDYFYDGDKGGIPENLFDIGNELIELNKTFLNVNNNLAAIADNLEKLVNILSGKYI